MIYIKSLFVNRKIQNAAVITMIIILTISSYYKITGSKIVKDAKQNVITSYYIWTEGIFAEESGVKSYKREPLPLIISSLYIDYFTDIPNGIGLQELLASREYRKSIISINVFYTFVLLISVWWLTRLLTKSNYTAVVAILLSWFIFITRPAIINRMYTELPVSILIVLIAAFSILLFQKKTLFFAGVTGLFLGLISLTKAPGLYVSYVEILVFPAALFLFKLTSKKRSVMILAAIAVMFYLTISPWMLRNYFNFNDFSISQRGGDVLLTRAAKNQMTWDEYSGSFYVYSPKWIRKNVFEKFLGFNNGDLLPGGRFVRLIRYQPGDAEAIKAGDVEKTISYYARVRAVISKKDIEYSKQGLPIYLVDEDIKKLAIDMIKNDPIKHLLMTIPFLWRGNIIIFLSLISMLTISIIKKKPDWFAFSLFGVGLFMFYALLSHFIVRYSTPLIPLAIVSILVMMNSLIMKLLKITLPAKPLTR